MSLGWNSGGWFGAQLGGSCWILIAAIISAAHDLVTAVLLSVIFLVVNGIGLLLWHGRKLSCYAAIQILMLLTGVCGLLAVYILDSRHYWLKIQLGGQVSAFNASIMLSCIVGALMLMFYLKYGRQK